MLRRLAADGAPVLAVARQAEVERGHPRLRPGQAAARPEQVSVGRRGARCGLRSAIAWSMATPPAPRRMPPVHQARRQRAGCRGRRPRWAPIRAMWVVPSTKPLGHEGKHFIDYQNDVTAADVALAHREGYRSVEHLKRYTTTGMATDQGKTSNVNALAMIAEAARHQRAGGRHHHVPPALYAGDDRRVLRHRQGRLPRPDPQDADPFLARAAWRAVRDRGPVAPRLVLSEVRREHARRGQPRSEGRAHLGRHRRCLDPGQDRHPGARRRLVPQHGLHQRLVQAGAGQVPLRPDAGRGRHGDG